MDVMAAIIGGLVLWVLVTYSIAWRITMGPTHRLNVDLTEEQWKGLNRLRYGDRKAAFCALVDGLNRLLDTNNPEKVVGGITSGSIGIRDLIDWKED